MCQMVRFLLSLYLLSQLIMDRREFLKIISAGLAAGISFDSLSNTDSTQLLKPSIKKYGLPADIYEFPAFGNASFIHITDVHAQLLPNYYREPESAIKLAQTQDGQLNVSGNDLLNYYGRNDEASKYVLTHLDFAELAQKFGRLGGFAYIKTLVDQIKEQRPGALLLDGGDSWQGSATSLWTRGQDMVDANIKLGVNIATGHWEFTYGADRFSEIIKKDYNKNNIDFVAQNIVDKNFEDQIFQPFVLRSLNGIPCAIIGQAFPYTSLANPKHLVPDWSFGLREQALQDHVYKARKLGAQLVILLSHNGMGADLKLAKRIRGLNAILGGHTHQATVKPILVANPTNKTIVINSGAAGKFLSLLDFEVKKGKVTDFRYRLIPVFSNIIKPNVEMNSYINKVRKPYIAKLKEKLAQTEHLLYRRGTFNSSFDQLILDSLESTFDAEVIFSPGFRFGTSVLPGSSISYEDILNQTAITYPIVIVNYFTGKQIHNLLEHIADNSFNIDPYKQQGGDMVRVGKLKYSIRPRASFRNRISNLTLNGKLLSPNKRYKIVGWADVSQTVEGQAIWDVVANYLRSKKTISINEINLPKVILK